MLLGFLIGRLDLNVVGDSFKQVGFGLFYILSTSFAWFYFNALSQDALMDTKISIWKLLYSQMTGDAYTTILPLAGVGGDPYKIKYLNEHIPIDEASRVVVLERIMHMVGGFLFGFVFLLISIFVVPVEGGLMNTLIMGTALFGVLFIVASFLMLSRMPGSITGFFLKKLNLFEGVDYQKLSKLAFLKSLIYRFLSRIANFAEIYLIFILLGFDPTFSELVFVTVIVGVSSILFFFIPGGIGVNELSINGALKIFGYSDSIGLSIGLMRRARILTWAMIGVFIHFLYIVHKKRNKIKKKRKKHKLKH
jgi:hypothetical protein